MKKCWRQSPEERPRFSELVATLDKTLQTVADYIELSMTLDRGGDQEEEEEEEEEEEDWNGYEVIQYRLLLLWLCSPTPYNIKLILQIWDSYDKTDI